MNGDLATPQVGPKPRDLAQRYLAAKTLLFSDHNSKLTVLFGLPAISTDSGWCPIEFP